MTSLFHSDHSEPRSPISEPSLQGLLEDHMATGLRVELRQGASQLRWQRRLLEVGVQVFFHAAPRHKEGPGRPGLMAQGSARPKLLSLG